MKRSETIGLIILSVAMAVGTVAFTKMSGYDRGDCFVKKKLPAATPRFCKITKVGTLRYWYTCQEFDMIWQTTEFIHKLDRETMPMECPNSFE